MNQIKTSLFQVGKVSLDDTKDREGNRVDFLRMELESPNPYAGANGTYVELVFLAEHQVEAWRKKVIAHEIWAATREGKNPMPPMEAAIVTVENLPAFHTFGVKDNQWSTDTFTNMKVFTPCFNGEPINDPRKKALSVLKNMDKHFKLASAIPVSDQVIELNLEPEAEPEA